MKSFSENLGLLSFATNADGTGVESPDGFDCPGRLEIPAQFAGQMVKAIGERAFENCVGLKTILIPDTVHSIADGASPAAPKFRKLACQVPSKVWQRILQDVSLASIFFDGDAPSLPQSGSFADVTHQRWYVDAYADGFEFTYGGLKSVAQT